MIFFPDPANFSASGGVGVQFPTVRNCPEFEFFQNSSNTACVPLNTNSGKNFGKIWQHLEELGTKETPKRVAQKHLKVYNLTTTNAIKMKLTMIMYLHETFHLTKD